MPGQRKDTKEAANKGVVWGVGVWLQVRHIAPGSRACLRLRPPALSPGRTRGRWGPSPLGKAVQQTTVKRCQWGSERRTKQARPEGRTASDLGGSLRFLCLGLGLFLFLLCLDSGFASGQRACEHTHTHTHTHTPTRLLSARPGRPKVCMRILRYRVAP